MMSRTNGGKPPTFDARLFLTTVGAGRSTAKYRPQANIFAQGDPADAVFYIQKGNVQLTVVSEHGKEGVIAMPGAGDFFGEGCLAGQPLHIASATAMSNSIIVRIEKETMVRVLHQEPTLSEMFMAFLLSRGSRRSTVQFKRKTARPDTPAARQFRQGRKARTGDSKDQPGNLGRAGRDDPFTDQLLHEQVPEARIDRVQW
jgi:CRP-like cAMP-binding protein